MRFLQIAIFLVLTTMMPVFGQKVNNPKFIIPLNADRADALEYPFNAVKPGDTVWIQSGTRDHLQILNFHGQSGHPIVFANQNGQVVIDTENNFGLSFNGCSFFKLTGKSGSYGSYGIYIRRVSFKDGIGISASSKSTEFEIENCEVANIGSIGIQTKTEPDCKDSGTLREGFTQRNTVIHDCYVHDVGTEGFYIGYNDHDGFYASDCKKTIYASELVGTKIYNNRIERTGWDGLQVASAISDCLIYDNTVVDSGILMTSGQMAGIMIGGGTQARCYNNKIIDSYGSGIQVFGNGGTVVYNNLIIRPAKRYQPDNPDAREYGIYLFDKTNELHTFYGIYNNTIIQPKSDGIRVANTVDFAVQIYNNSVVDPGAYDIYEHDNTAWVGNDAYVFNEGRSQMVVASNNYFDRSLDAAKFVNVAGNNFRLQVTSPMVDAGKALIAEGVTTDLDDRVRPVGKAFDIGAYEYSESQSVGYVEQDSDFRVGSLALGAGKQLILTIDGSRMMKVHLCMTDLLGRVLFDRQNLDIAVGTNKLTIPANVSGMVILTIQSDRFSYARKIVLL